MPGCCEPIHFDGASVQYKRALRAVIGINALMFAVEVAAGLAADSQAMKADALDFASDTLTYAISLSVIGASLSTRAHASVFKALTLGAIAIYILGVTMMRIFEGSAPDAHTMELIGVIAFFANLLSVVLLLRWRDGDSNVRSVWLCSRNDALGNLGVVTAGLLVSVTESRWPDLFMGSLLALLFLRSASSILIQARAELSGQVCVTEVETHG
ncbi:MAG: cation transporter [Pseudomonadota bacterium]